MANAVTKHFAIARRVTDWHGCPVDIEGLQPHTELKPGLFLLRSTNDPMLMAVVPALDEIDLARRVRQGELIVWRVT